jgi:hypothetical protein
LGEQVALTDTVRDFAGRPVTGQTVTWTSSDSAFATVDSLGLVTAGLFNASFRVTATSGTRTGFVDLQSGPLSPVIDNIAMWSGFVAGSTMHEVEITGSHFTPTTAILNIGTTDVAAFNVRVKSGTLILADILVDSAASGTRTLYALAATPSNTWDITLAPPAPQDSLPACAAGACNFLANTTPGHRFTYDFYQRSSKVGQTAYIHIPPNMVPGFYTPDVFSCPGAASGTFYYTFLTQTLFIAPVTWEITNKNAIDSITTTQMQNCGDFANGPVVLLGNTQSHVRGQYLRFIPSAGLTGEGVVQMKVVAEEASHVAGAPYKVGVFGLNLRP